MATLIKQVGNSGTRRCDAHCYGAKGDKCTCVCGGVNHGKGLQQALENTKAMATSILEQANNTEIAGEILHEIRASA